MSSSERSSEHRLRNRIRNAFHLDDPSLSRDVAARAENEVLTLIRNYSAAPESEKDDVYHDGEERLMRLLGRSRGGQSVPA